MKRVRIGVTGHRHFDETPLVDEMIDHVLDRILADGGLPTIVSSLAEGGDRRVAAHGLARTGGVLEVLLPVPPADFSDDFATSGSRREFRELLDCATSVDVVEQRDGDTREDAYERAGRQIVDTVDVVVALWDGKPGRGRGGTAEIVQYALDHDVLVEVVLVMRPG